MKSWRSFFSSTTRTLLAGVLALSLAGAGCTKLVDQETQALSAPKTLTMWGVIDDAVAYESAITAYSQRYPNVRIDFRRLRLEEYETELLNAMAEDRGPDIFLVHHDWTNKYLSKISSMPPSVRVAERTVQGSVKKEVVWQSVNQPLMTNREFKDAFVDTVLADTMRVVNVSTDPLTNDFRERVVGVPTFIDTLALYYNRSLLNAAGIPLPPETWDDFQTQVKRLTRRDPRDTAILTQSGAAFGTGANIERSVDVLTSLMMQNGAVMSTREGYPAFHLIPQEFQGSAEAPSFGAIRFYSEFADPTKDTYTWNADQPNSLEAFIQGRTAFFFGYAYQQDTILSRAPQLNLGITKLPQIVNRPQATTANYWYWTVAKRSKESSHAWNFVNTLAQKPTQTAIASVTGRPSPRRDVLAEQLRDEKMGVFASQVLNAKTWYQGKNPQAMEQAMIRMMDAIANKETSIEEAVKFTIEQIEETY
ncbi:MAG: Extracellular solute-binding protein [Patescibacteria group bacterium]|nr:Extracellular solute-binding protein [Patescibacteria group bacterium]